MTSYLVLKYCGGDMSWPAVENQQFTHCLGDKSSDGSYLAVQAIYIADLNTVTSQHVSVFRGDDILRQFWELEARQWPIALLL